MDDKRKAELIALAKKELPEDELKKKYAKQPVKRFMISDKVDNGPELIPAFLVYERYLDWANDYKVEPLSKVVFFKEFATYVEKKQTGKGMFYKLSSRGFNLSPQYVEMIRKKYGAKTTKKRSTKPKKDDQG